MPAKTVTEHIEKAIRKIDASKNIDHWDRNLGRYDAEELMAEVLGRKLTPALLERILDGTSRKRSVARVARRVTEAENTFPYSPRASTSSISNAARSAS